MKITNLNKRFGDNVIFNNADFTFKDGKITYIMGRSGAGKTTLLRIIAGLDKDFTGEISDIGKLAYVFQEPRLFPTLSVLENLKIVTEVQDYDPMELLNTVELIGFEDLLPSELSGGMKMRLALARAIYYDADVILMDEPFASLDKDMKNRIATKIFDLLKDKTVIVVSHDEEDAEKFADEIIKL